MEQKKPRHLRAVFGYFAEEVRRRPIPFAIALVGNLVVQGAGLISPLYLRLIFNALASSNRSPAAIHGLVVIVIIIGAIAVVQWLAGRIQSSATIMLESRAMASLYQSTFAYLIDHSYQFFISEFAGTLTRRVSKYASAFETIFDAIITNFLPTAFFVIGAVVILFLHNHVLGVMLGLWSVLFVILQIFLSRIHRPYRLKRAEEDSRVVGTLADAIGNQNTITLFAGSSYEESRFGERVNAWSKAQLRAWRVMASIWGTQGFLMVIINVALLYGAVIFWSRGELTVGDFVLIQTYLLGTFDMLNGITQQLRRFYDAVSDADEMVAILNTPHAVADVVGAMPLAVSAGAVAFNDVLFYFRKENPVLSDFNLAIKPGEKVALVGPSGAGKSTITKLLLRLYDVMGGSITIDGQDIAKVQQDSLREAIAFVPQEPILFHRSLMENIRYGRRDATDEEVFEAARKAHCHEFIVALPDGYETFVGERGVKLSGGERQRIAIARAILKDAPILLLDEATSSLDSESESLIQDSLKVLMEGKSVLVIAHRLSTIMNMDRIVVLQAGEVIAQGTHDELLAQGGLYQKLWNIQAGGFLQDEEVESLS